MKGAPPPRRGVTRNTTGVQEKGSEAAKASQGTKPKTGGRGRPHRNPGPRGFGGALRAANAPELQKRHHTSPEQVDTPPAGRRPVLPILGRQPESRSLRKQRSRPETAKNGVT